MTTGRKIRRVRMDQELSQRELAQRAGLSMNAISLIERELRTPGIDTLAKIAYALGVSPGELIEEPTLPKVDAPSLGQPETRTVGVLAPRLPPKVTVPDARGLDEFSDEELLDHVRATVDTAGAAASRILPPIAEELSENILAAAERGDRDAVVMHAQIADLTRMGAYRLYVEWLSELYDEVQKRALPRESEDVEALEELLANEYAATNRLAQKIHEAQQEALSKLPEGPRRDAVVHSLAEWRRRRASA